MESRLTRRTSSQKKLQKNEEREKLINRKTIKLSKCFSFQKSLLFYGFIISFSLLILGLSYQVFYSSYKVNFVDDISYNLGLHSNIYAVVIDAGSTGSRILAFSFYKSAFDGSLKLQNDLFVYSKPGLSNFADNPKQGAETIAKLLENAKEFIPQKVWSSTPIALRATAGLRLLPTEKADHLLNEVQVVINDSPFLSDENSVSIMDGKDEGLFLWFTVNFLLDHLSNDISESVVTLDLGGGSLQITFIPESSERIAKETPDHLYKVSIMNKDVDTYSYSYLGLGLMAARRRVLLKENAENVVNLVSTCVHPVVANKSWSYGGTSYSVSGNSKTDVKLLYSKCYEIAKRVVQETKVDKPKEIFHHKITVFSYFFDRAAEAGLIDSEGGGTLTVNDFKIAANNSCSNSNADQPFACLDLTFIAALFEHGFGLKHDTKITLQDKIDGHEISWALGAAYKILEERKN